MNKNPRTAKRPARARPKKAYITAPPLTDTTLVRRALEAKGVSTFSPDELDLPGQNMTEAMRDALTRVDLVVALVDSTKESNLVFYELGLAQALGKPAVVLLARDASAETWVACGIPSIRFDPMNPSGLDFGIDLILATPRQAGKSRPAAEKQTHALGKRAQAFLAQLKEAGDALTADDFETLIADVIRASGVQILSTSEQAQNGINIAVWSNDLSPWVVNPLLIQLKLRPRTARELTDSAELLRRSLSPSGMLWALLLYHGSAVEPSIVPTPPNVLLLRAETFIEELQTIGFGDLVRRLRNQRVHGAR